MRAEPKMVTPGTSCESVSNESTNSAMMRKMRQGSSLIKVILVSFMRAENTGRAGKSQASTLNSRWHEQRFEAKLVRAGVRNQLDWIVEHRACRTRPNTRTAN